jgi:hypothetical protein
VQTRAGVPDPRQEAAFTDQDVVAIVGELMRHNDAGLVRLARLAVIGDPPAARDELRAQLRSPQGAEATEAQLNSAEAISAAGARIYSRPECDRLRGGLLERYVHELVARRAGSAVQHEAQVELPEHPHSGNGWSKPKEIVVNAVPFEAYECKFGGHVNQDDVNELGDVYVSAKAEGTEARPCIAVMASERALKARLEDKGVQLDEVLYFSDLTDLPVLGQRPPSRRLR